MLKLLSHNEPIVSGTYPMKTIPIRYCVEIEPEERKGDLLKVGGNGMGFVMIHRNVFTDIARKFPDLKYIPSTQDSNYLPTEAEMDNSYHFFMEEKIDDSFASEDKSFFYRARMAGYTHWLDTTIKLQHVGSHVFAE